MADSHSSDRRQFIKTSSAVVAVAAASPGILSADDPTTAPPEKPLKKAVKIGMVRVKGTLTDKFKLLKQLGFDGVEMNSPGGPPVKDILQAIDASGLPVHGVVDSIHWRDTLSHPDPAVRARGVAGLKTAIRTSKEIGGDTVLLVPAVVNKQVSYGDAYKRSQIEIKKALPLAEELGITIALENVWNNFLLSPLEMARYIDELESKNIGSYFDVGNVIRFAWPEHWIEALGERIVKLDIKEFSRKKQNNGGLPKGFGVKLLEGDCDWPAVMKALKKIAYSGWATAEIPGGDRERLAEIAERMDRIFAS